MAVRIVRTYKEVSLALDQTYDDLFGISGLEDQIGGDVDKNYQRDIIQNRIQTEDNSESKSKDEDKSNADKGNGNDDQSVKEEVKEETDTDEDTKSQKNNSYRTSN